MTDVGPTPPERRAHLRASAAATTTIGWRLRRARGAYRGAAVGEAVVINVSRGGMAIETDAPFTRGTVLEVTASSDPALVPVGRRATVLRVEGAAPARRVALEFAAG